MVDNEAGSCVCEDGAEMNEDGTCGCPAGQIFDSGECYCPSGFVMNEVDECVCPAGQIEEAGACWCPDGQSFNDGGECSCPPTLVLNNGTCACPDGQEIKDNGECGCPPTQVLNNGTCECSPGLVMVDEVCVNITTPDECPDGTRNDTETGVCRECWNGEYFETLCPEIGCVDLYFNNTSCGSCGNACVNSTCWESICIWCPEGQTPDSGSGCIPVGIDEPGTPSPPNGTETCSAEIFEYSCPGVDGCVNIRSNNTHCGACGHVCYESECYLGECISCPSGQTPETGSDCINVDEPPILTIFSAPPSETSTPSGSGIPNGTVSATPAVTAFGDIGADSEWNGNLIDKGLGGWWD